MKWMFGIVVLVLQAGCVTTRTPHATAITTDVLKPAIDVQIGPGPYCNSPDGVSGGDAKKAYEHWKKTLVTRDGANGFRRVIRPDTPDGKANSTVSEGISYGMILAVYHNDQALFDDLFKYALYWADETGLMNWYIGADGNEACPGRDECGAATDASEDIAFALVMADYRWGGQGSLDNSYSFYARRQIALVKKHEVHDSYILKPGNRWGGPDLLNLSYFAPAFFEVFGRYTNEQEFWNKVIDVNYQALFASLNQLNGNSYNGLAPAWSNQQGEPVEAFPNAPTHYQTDSARIPFRLAQHYCWTGDARAKRYLDLVNSFVVPLGADNLTDEYELDGTPKPMHAPEASSQSAVIVGTFAAAAMAGGAQDFVKQASELLMTFSLTARSTYYQLSWTAMSMLFIAGDYSDMSAANK